MKTLLTTTRRGFLGATGAAGLFSIVPRHVLGGPGQTAPSEKLAIAGIGIGGMGGGNLRNCEGEAIVALCDVDSVYAKHTFDRYPQAKRYRDYRAMLAGQTDIDAVVIATPDHTHAEIAMAAMKAGKHVYCQKPLTHDIYEARCLAAAARETGVKTQMGIQGHSQEGLRLICEWIWGGVIGEIRQVHAWCSLSYDPPGHASWSTPVSARPAEGMPVPDTLDWETWIGPAPMRPYHTCYHPRVWRRWWDFGCGMMGDRGAHTLDSVFTALKLGDPTTVEAADIRGGDDDLHPAGAVITYRFPQRGALPPLELMWFEGREPPRPPELEAGRELAREGGVLFKGETGTIMCGVYGNSPRLIPESAMKAATLPAKTLPRITVSHEQNWIAACKGGPAASAEFAYSGPLTELTLLGNVAKRFPGQALAWDGPGMTIANLPAANDWIKRPRRAGHLL